MSKKKTPEWCGVGKTVYGFTYLQTEILVVAPETVESIHKTAETGELYIETDEGCYTLDALGRTLFPTQEEAEAKLKERES